MFKYSICLLSLMGIQLNSCKSMSQSNLQEVNNNSLELVLNENYSGFDQEEYFLIKNQKELDDFYGKINRTRKPGLTPPSINFNSDMILVWCGDSKVSNFASFELNEKDDFLEISEYKPKTSKEESLFIVSPFSVYKLPISNKSLKIVK